jgi:hypothetical protein
MRRNDNPDIRHITPHRAWAYLYADPTAELSTKEHDHISECEQCLRLFILCLKSKTFGSVLKALGKDLDDRRSA